MEIIWAKNIIYRVRFQTAEERFILKGYGSIQKPPDIGWGIVGNLYTLIQGVLKAVLEDSGHHLI